MSNHTFSPKIACAVGVNAAVIYQNILFWTEKNAANNRHLHDGSYWTYNSIAAFEKLFPYLSGKQIRTALSALESAGLIISGTFNKSGYDRTKWYCPVGQVDLTQRANGSAPEGEPIPDNKPVKKQSNNIREILSTWLMDEEAADSFIAYRKSIKKPLTETAAKRLSEKLRWIFVGGGEPSDALAMCEEKGWQSIEVEWFFKSLHGEKSDSYKKAMTNIEQAKRETV